MDQYGAYARYLDCLSGTGDRSCAVLRVPTLAEWHGDVLHSAIVECARCGVGVGVGRALAGVAGPAVAGPVRAGVSGGGVAVSAVGVSEVGSAEVAEGCGVVRAGSERSDVSYGGDGVVKEEAFVRGRHWKKNRDKKVKKRAMRGNWRSPVVAGRGGYNSVVSGSGQANVDGSGGCVSDESAAGSVCTVDTRTGIEIEAAQTLAARRVAENRKAEAEAKVAEKIAEHRLKALSDKDRTIVVERLAAARYEQKINEARLRAQTSFSKSQDSLKSLGSMGSAGELYARQAIKKSRDNEKLLKYVQDQAEFLLRHVTPEVRQQVAEMPEPEYEDEFEVFGDCPSDYNEEQREAYYDDLNRRNAEHGLVGTGPPPPQRIPTPEELRRIEEEIRALSVY